MARPAVLILEPDADASAALTDVLSGANDVYAADSPNAVLQALGATRFPVVVVATRALDGDGAAFVSEVLARQPETMVVFVGEGCSTDVAISLMRAGAADFLQTPADDEVVAARVAAAVERWRVRRNRLKLWEKRAKTAERSLRDARTGSGQTVTTAPLVSEFVDYALDTFVALERQNMEFERELRAQDPSASGKNHAPLPTWVALSDPEFANGIVSLAGRLTLDIAPPMSTGGEVLDKASSAPPKLLVVDDGLPDIPAELLVSTLHAEQPEIPVVTIEGWGTDDSHVRLSGSGLPEERRPMTTVDDLIAVLESAVTRARDIESGRSFAAQFSTRHSDFLQRVAEVRRAIEST